MSSPVAHSVKDLVLSLQWLGVAALAGGSSLAQELPYATGMAKIKEDTENLNWSLTISTSWISSLKSKYT